MASFLNTYVLTCNSPTDIDRALASLDLLLEIIDESGGSALMKCIDEILVGVQLLAASACGSDSLAVRRKSFSVLTRLAVGLSQDEELEAAQSINVSPWVALGTELSHSDIPSVISILRDIRSLLETPLLPVIAPLISTVLSESVGWLGRSRSTFESLVVIAEEGGIDEDETEGGLVTLVVSIIELLDGISENDISEGILKNNINSIFSALAPYLQISISNEFEWNSNPNDFIANEQDEFATSISIRLSFEGLLADCLDNPFVVSETIDCTGAIGINLIREGMSKFENPQSWRLIEAGLFMVSFLDLSESADVGQIVQFCANFSTDDSAHELLRARAFLVLSRMVDVAVKHFPNDIVSIMSRSIECMSKAPVLAYSATKAFGAFLRPSRNDQTRSTVLDMVMRQSGALVCLAKMANNGSDETLHYALETLLELTRVYPEVVNLSGNDYFEFLKKLLVTRASDPFIPDEILELVKIVQLSVEPTVFDNLIEIFASELMQWLHADAECELDTSLEFLVYFVEHTNRITFDGKLLECILILAGGTLDNVGPETSERVSNILRVCADRTPGDSSPMNS
jgi:hypothetical protein